MSQASVASGAQDRSAMIVSVDDHVQESRTTWSDRLPKRFREVMPRVVREQVTPKGLPASGDGAVWADVWYYEGARVPLLRAYASVGFDPSDVKTEVMTYDDMRPGCYDPVARLDDMDLNGVEASLCFPNLFVRFCGQRFLEAVDKDLARLCVLAYNDWLIEEWTAVAPTRLLPAAIIPLWDGELAAAEVRRNAERGCRAVCFSEIPAWLGLPSMYDGAWEPFFDACSETRTVICMHIGSTSTTVTTSADAPLSVPVANDYVKSSLSLSDWLVSGAFVRHPDIRVMYAEAQAGWMPYIVSRLDAMWKQANAYNEVASRLPEPPSTYLQGHVYACIFDDPVAIAHIDDVGSDNLCFETDYPHPDSTWPRSQEVARRHLAGLAPEVAEKILRGNAIRLFDLAL